MLLHIFLPPAFQIGLVALISITVTFDLVDSLFTLLEEVATLSYTNDFFSTAKEAFCLSRPLG